MAAKVISSSPPLTSTASKQARLDNCESSCNDPPYDMWWECKTEIPVTEGSGLAYLDIPAAPLAVPFYHAEVALEPGPPQARAVTLPLEGALAPPIHEMIDFAAEELSPRRLFALLQWPEVERLIDDLRQAERCTTAAVTTLYRLLSLIGVLRFILFWRSNACCLHAMLTKLQKTLLILVYEKVDGTLQLREPQPLADTEWRVHISRLTQTFHCMRLVEVTRMDLAAGLPVALALVRKLNGAIHRLAFLLLDQNADDVSDDALEP